jgi:hypothetical protein
VARVARFAFQDWIAAKDVEIAVPIRPAKPALKDCAGVVSNAAISFFLLVGVSFDVVSKAQVGRKMTPSKILFFMADMQFLHASEGMIKLRHGLKK